MNVALLRAVAIFAVAGVLFFWSTSVFFKRKTLFSFLQLLGAGFLTLVGLFHIFEALHLFPSMGWGLPHSIGHYLDLTSAVLGILLFPLGYLLSKINLWRK